MYIGFFEYDIIDVRTFLTRHSDSKTASCAMVNQEHYLVTIDLIDVHSNTFIEIWS